MIVPTTQRHVPDIVGGLVGEYVADLQERYLRDLSSAVGQLAQLRRGAGKLPQDVPELWGMLGTDRLFREPGLSEAEKSRGEAAMFTAITLYALHQQSHPQHRMHRPKAELGAAVRRLMPPGELDEPIRRRFVQLGMATTPDVLAIRLREIITLLRREAIPLDYALLASQLCQAQEPGGMSRVRQSWGRSFHAYRPKNVQSPSGEDGETATEGDLS